MRAALFVTAIVVSLCADAVPIGLRTAMVSPAVVSPNTLPQIAENADADAVNSAIDSVGFADQEVKEAICGNAEKYVAFREWAQYVRFASGNPAGGAAAAASPYAWAAYCLGAEALFENEPQIIINESMLGSGADGALTVGVSVKDGVRDVPVDTAKIATMFEATSDLLDWVGDARIVPTVQVLGEGNSSRFNVVPMEKPMRFFVRVRVK